MPTNSIRSLLRSVFAFSALTFCSRILGYLRDVSILTSFGAGVAADAFLVAFKLPNLLRRILAEGALSQVFIPVFQKFRKKNNTQETVEFVNSLSGILSAGLLLLSVIGVCAAPILVLLFAPGFYPDAERFDLAVEMLRITAPYLFFVASSAFAAAILNSYGHFAIPAFSPIILNSVLILAALLFAPLMEEPIVTLAWGVLVAGVLQLTLQLAVLYSKSALPIPSMNFANSGAKYVLKLMIPSAIGAAVIQLNLLVDTILASFLLVGSISWLYISNRFVEMPLALVGISISTVTLPKLAIYFAQGDKKSFSNILDWSINNAFMLAMPCCIGLVVLAFPILSTFMQYGAFAQHDADMARWSLVMYACGLPTFVLAKIFSGIFYSCREPWVPMRAVFYSVASNIILSVGLICVWQWYSLPAPHAVLSFTTAIASLVNLGLLYQTARRHGRFSIQPTSIHLAGKIFLVSVTMGIALWVFTPHETTWSQWSFLSRSGCLSGLILSGIAIYYCLSRSMGIQIWTLLRGQNIR